MARDLIFVVMGAGASYDAARPDRYLNNGERDPDWRTRPLRARIPFDQRWRLPLAEELFDDRDQSFGDVLGIHDAAVPLVQRLQRLVRRGTDVELAMRSVEREARQSEVGRVQLLELGWYLQDVILNAERVTLAESHGMTNQRLLADTLEKWRGRSTSREVVYATFNYDRLIENGVDAIDRRRSIDDLVRSADGSLHATRVYKLHGSADWGYVVPSTRNHVAGFSNTSDVRRAVREGASPTSEILPSSIDRSGMWSVHATGPGGQLLYPAIALPARGKGSFVLPEWQLSQLQNDLKRATRFLFVGWRGADEHFMRLVRRHVRSGRHVDVVSGNSGLVLASRLSRALRTPRQRIEVYGRFSDYMEQPGLLAKLLTRRA